MFNVIQEEYITLSGPAGPAGPAGPVSPFLQLIAAKTITEDKTKASFRFFMLKIFNVIETRDIANIAI